MQSRAPNALLAQNDPDPVDLVGASLASSPFVLIGDHAGNVVPKRLGGLGIDPAELERHIGIDIGVEALGRAMAAMLDAPFLHQRFSRLVIDCNRAPDAPDLVPAVSDGTLVPANADLQPTARQERLDAIHTPYHEAIARLLDRRAAAGLATVFVALHSFTPRLAGQDRPWHLGVLHDGHGDAFARGVLAALHRRADLVTGDNEPYRMDGIDYTVPRHAFPRALPYVELEVRQDLVQPQREGDVERMAAVLCEALRASAAATL
ncbi:N-formylglutamate amidohydrolase [Erythrobacteraceae bacterium CFH 75059]|uniref:N-formylglutamate amidohydrolase n=1 Tax=Qipengyuania thermophila TaxID=2509361 RepID=UPI001021AD12|nr:N-formylglutamate amidohydrolase [Qipengyuania thermophila]TCD04307.1 N-formylglutamate amidohydrolase [Erythrobacteraceae bacterium CFH 75059]